MAKKTSEKDESKNKIIYVKTKDLMECKWNYKEKGTPKQMKKLRKSIEHDGSVGVFPVREMKDGYEVLDGNHRLQAAIQLGWEVVPCENFGKISNAEAITIARRRNYEWFRDDPMKLASLMVNDVMPEITLDELEEFMPDDRAGLEAFQAMVDFDVESINAEYDDIEEEEKDSNIKDFDKIKINITLPEVTAQNWLKWRDLTLQHTKKDNDLAAFQYALTNAMEYLLSKGAI